MKTTMQFDVAVMGRYLTDGNNSSEITQLVAVKFVFNESGQYLGTPSMDAVAASLVAIVLNA